MSIRPDLHLHTGASDGDFSPEALVDQAVQAGLTVMALTDHDTMAGVDSLQGQALPIPLIRGVELSLCDRPALHLLGYGNREAPRLRAKLRELAESRLHRADAMVDALCKLGMPLDKAVIQAKAQGTLGRPHIADALVEAGFAANRQDAFERYLAEGRPAYVPGERMNMREALSLLRSEGFVPVLAHPALLEMDDMTLRPILTAWQSQGLMGVEVYHPAQTLRGYAQLERMARSLRLLVTGGSDFHRIGDGHGSIGCTADAWTNAEQDVASLYAAMDAN